MRPSRAAKPKAVATDADTDAGTDTYTDTTEENVEVQTERQRVVLRLSVWAAFGVFFGLLPLFALVIKELFSESGFHINRVLGTGELFVVAAVLAAGAMGDWVASAFKGNPGVKSIFAVFFCLAGFAGNTMAYMQVSNARPSLVVALSTCFFLPSLLASGVCVGMAAR
ncbi:hypothetical protein [Catellatospora tritici]|uniref:hypothetical protein n=1 Tax=Catellatospora tritici TaxID=2851566 RepID=UPI001C2D89BF|nr:hypothetical protein [Catellatospora tritici]MBV1851879.1 hypothetical protein [Catellatospora tritici]